MSNYYVVLGVAEDADSETIRTAFRALARRYHPDAGAGSSAAEFRRALEAYETLSDPERRRLHDRHLRASRATTTITERIVMRRSVAEPLFTAQPVFFGFPNRRLTIIESALLDERFDELFSSVADDWFWHWRMR